LRRKQADKKTCDQTHRRQRTEAYGELAQPPPLKKRLLKPRQRGYLGSIHIEIDLHTTPVFDFVLIAIRYDITKSVKFLYSIALSKNAQPVACLKP